jgi:predicted nicotinamide N-methyase
VGYDLEDLADMNGSKKVNPAKKQSTSNEKADGQSVSVSSSRRKRKQEEQQDSLNGPGFNRRFTPSFSNTAQLDVGSDGNIVLTKGDNAFISRIADELIAYDPDLLYQPERAFTFSSGESCHQMTVILPQSCADVGTTIWDAETLLAHFVFNRYLNDKVATKRVLELGAGTALAALTWQQSAPSDVVVVQELPEVVVSLQQSLLLQAGGSSITCVGGIWGNELLNHPVISEVKFDVIMMADVFYHEEHFGELLATTFGALNVGGDVIAVFEQRRKDLSAVVQQFASHAFQNKSVVQFDVSRKVQPEDSGESFPTITTFYVCHFQGFVA